MNKILKSNLANNLKINVLRATVESVLVYGAITWTLTKSLEKNVDRNYTRMLRVALNKSWRDYPTIKDMYGNTPRLSTTIRRQRLSFSDHCWSAKGEMVADVILCHPSYGKPGKDIPTYRYIYIYIYIYIKTYIDQLVNDTVCRPDEIQNEIDNQEEWRKDIMNR